MSAIVLDIPGDTLLALKLAPEEAGAALRMAAAVKLFELGQLSSGAAARLAGVPRGLSLTIGRLRRGHLSPDRRAT